MKELKKLYTDIPGMEGFEFRQIEKSPHAYLYRVNSINHYLNIPKEYEVVIRDGIHSYPFNMEIGERFWNFKNLSEARKKMIELNS